MTDVRVYQCKLVRVVDGDTMDVTVDLGFEVYIRVRIRLMGVNAPEMDTTAGRRVKAAVNEWFGDLNRIHLLRSFSAKDKYGRRICDFEHAETHELLSTWLLTNGMAAPWPTPKKRIADPWERHEGEIDA